MLSTGQKEKLFSYAETIHMRIFGHAMSEEMRRFLGNLSWSFFGGIIAAGIMLSVNIAAGRILGPVEYGKYGLVIALSSILLIPMLLGLDVALTHFIAQSNDKKDIGEKIASTAWIVITSIFITSFFIFSMTDFLTDFISTDKKLIYITLVFAVILVFRNLADAIVKGLFLYKFQSTLRIIEASVIFALFLIMLLSLDSFFYSHYISVILLGYILTIILSFKVVRFKPLVSKKFSLSIVHYGLYAALGAYFMIATYSLDKNFINKYIGADELGLYNAYMTASLLLVMQLVTLFINVFFVYSSNSLDQGSILKKINKTSLYLSVPIFCAVYLMTCLIITLFGPEYGLNFQLVALVSILSTVVVYSTILWWLIASSGTSGVKFTSTNGFVAGTAFIVLVVVSQGFLTISLLVMYLIFANMYLGLAGNLYYVKINRIKQL